MAVSPRRRKTDQGWYRIAPDWLPERFYRDLWLLIVTGLVLWALVGNSQRLDDIQRERAHNTLLSCQRANTQNSAILGFITASVPAGRRNDPQILTYLIRAGRTFPQQDCQAVVRRQIKP